MFQGLLIEIIGTVLIFIFVFLLNYLNSKRIWEQLDDLLGISITFYSPNDGTYTLKIRGLGEGELQGSNILPHRKIGEIVTKSAQKTTRENPFLEVKNKSQRTYLSNVLLNNLTLIVCPRVRQIVEIESPERYKAKQEMLFVLTNERFDDPAQKHWEGKRVEKIRGIIFFEDDLKESPEMENVTYEVDHHIDRRRLMNKVSELVKEKTPPEEIILFKFSLAA